MEVVVAYFKTLSRYSSKQTERNHENLPLGYPTTGLKLETSRRQFIKKLGYKASLFE
jgi:hypothetical protein